MKTLRMLLSSIQRRINWWKTMPLMLASILLSWHERRHSWEKRSKSITLKLSPQVSSMMIIRSSSMTPLKSWLKINTSLLSKFCIKTLAWTTVLLFLSTNSFVSAFSPWESRFRSSGETQFTGVLRELMPKKLSLAFQLKPLETSW